METVKLKSGQLEGYLFEVFGYADPKTNQVRIQGLVREELPSETTKFSLRRFGKTLKAEFDTYQESVKELWNEYGEKGTNEEGQEILTVPKEKFEEFREKIEGLATADVDIKVPKFRLEEFDFKSKTPEFTYTILDLFFPEEETEKEKEG